MAGHITFAARRQLNAVFYLFSPLYLVWAPSPWNGITYIEGEPSYLRQDTVWGITDTPEAPSQGVLHLLKLTVKMNYPEPQTAQLKNHPLQSTRVCVRIPSTHIESLAEWRVFVTPRRERGDRRIPETHWSASHTEPISSKGLESLSQK